MIDEVGQCYMDGDNLETLSFFRQHINVDEGVYILLWIMRMQQKQDYESYISRPVGAVLRYEYSIEDSVYEVGI